MQFQSDIFGFPVVRPQLLEITALGAAYLAGLAVEFWADLESLKSQWKIDRSFNPEMDKEKAEGYLNTWHKAVKRAADWIE